MITLFPCRNIKSDAKRVFAWRNDPETVAASYYPRPKTWDSFWMEYSECYFRVPEFAPLFILEDSKEAGFMRFEPVELPDYPEKTVLEIMINIAPEYRNRHIGNQAVNAVKQALKEKNVYALVADIRKENKISAKMFEKCGFDFSEERTEYIKKINEHCFILCYRCIL